MKFTKFIFEIMKSVWTWVGLLMDIIGGIVYLKPDLAEKFSFFNVVQEYLTVWVILGIFLVIWSAWKVTNIILTEREKSTPSNFTHIEENNAPVLYNSSGNTFNTQNDIKVIIPDSKKKDELFEIHNEILVLMNKAIEDITWFTNGYQIESEPSLDEKKKAAFYSGKAFHEYLEKNKHLFREDLSNFLEDLDILSSLTIEREIIAIGGSSRDVILENEIRNEWKEKSKVLKQRATKEFHKRFPD